MGVWHNIRVNVTGNTLSEQQLYDACDRAQLNDVFVRKGRDGLVAEGQRDIQDPGGLAERISSEVRRDGAVQIIVRIYKIADRVWEHNVDPSGKVTINQK